MTSYWFKSYKYGYGWYPASWQGWVILLIFVMDIYFSMLYTVKLFGNNWNAVLADLPVIILTIVLVFIIVVKTGEKARWRWKKKNL